MASHTNKFGLYKKDPLTDGNDTFDIQTMMNDNWDRIDQRAAHEPFLLLNTNYDSDNDQLQVTIGPGRANFLGTLVAIDQDTTYSIASPTVNTDYYLFIRDDGSFAHNTNGSEMPGAVPIWKVSTGTTMDEMITQDLRGHLPEAGVRALKDNLDPRVKALEQKHIQQQKQTTSLQHGLNVLITNEERASLNIVKFNGRTVLNHVPHFNSGLWKFNANVTVDSDDKITLNADGVSNNNSYVLINVKQNTNYTLFVKHNGDIAVYNDGSTSIVDYTNAQTVIFNSGGNDAVRIYLADNSKTAGTYTFEKVMLNEGSTVQEYVHNLKGLRNPYVRAVGKNLLNKHKFEVGGIFTNGNEDNASTDRMRTKDYLPVMPNETYTVSIQESGYDGINVYWYDENKNIIDSYGSTAATVRTVTLPSNARYMRVVIYEPDITNAKVQLEIGDIVTEYEPYNEDYAYFLNDEPLFDEDIVEVINGVAHVTKKKKWRELTGDLGWSFNKEHSGFKSAICSIPTSAGLVNTAQSVKYNGLILESKTWGELETSADQVFFEGSADSGANRVGITISDTDSGWTDAMTPSADFIKAYFNGWKYTGDGTTHSWENMYDLGDTTTDVSVCLSRNIHHENGKEGYRIAYEMDAPETYEIEAVGSVTLAKESHVEVGEGLIYKERANPFLSAGYYRINDISYPDTYFNNKTIKIIEVLKNNIADEKWLIQNTNAIGEYRAIIKESDFDPNAVYEVTYIALPQYYTTEVQSIEVEYTKNIQTQVTENTIAIQNVKEDVFDLQQQKANREQPEWIEPILMNGWVNRTGKKLSYFKDEFNNVHIYGYIMDGSTSINTVLFHLPKEFRPLSNIYVEAMTWALEGSDVRPIPILIAENGEVKLGLSSSKYLLIKNYFQAEQ